MEVILIVAMSRNRVIGKDNDLAWHLPVDMRFFKEATRGFPVITGRKNFESIPHKFRPLPGRKNIVLTRQTDYDGGEGVAVVDRISDALDIAKAEGKEKAFIIGGGEIYRLAMEEGKVDRMFITEIDADVEGDTFFPSFELDDWDSQVIMQHPADESHAYDMRFMEYSLKESEG